MQRRAPYHSVQTCSAEGCGDVVRIQAVGDGRGKYHHREVLEVARRLATLCAREEALWSTPQPAPVK